MGDLTPRAVGNLADNRWLRCQRASERCHQPKFARGSLNQPISDSLFVPGEFVALTQPAIVGTVAAVVSLVGLRTAIGFALGRRGRADEETMACVATSGCRFYSMHALHFCVRTCDVELGRPKLN